MTPTAFLESIVQWISNAPLDDLIEVWNLTSEFPKHRERVLSGNFSKEARTFVQLSGELLEQYRSEPKAALIDNALLSVVVGVRLGLKSDSEIMEALDAMVAPPLGKPNALENLRRRLQSAK